MPELTAVRAVLPGWAGWSSLLLYLLLCLVATWVGFTAITWLNKERLVPGVHWSERARQLQPARKILNLCSWLLIVEYVLLSQYATGVLSPVPWAVFAVVVFVSLWVLQILLGWRFYRRWLGDWLTLGHVFKGQLTFWLILLPLLLVVVAMAVFVPAVAGPTLWIMVFGGVLLMFGMTVGGGFYLAKALGLVRPAPARVRLLVEQAAERADIPLRGAYVVVSPTVNAFALPFLGVVAFTDRALSILDDAEILAIAHHEVGHLAESASVKVKRLRPLFLFVVVGCWRPIVHYFGWWGLLIGVLVGLVINRWAVRGIHRREQAADAHVHAHVEEQGAADYARALEHLHAANLVPAVLRRKRKTHPDLYDRMLAAGVTPDFERPEPPPRRVRMQIASVLVVLLCVVAVMVPSMVFRGLAGRSEAAALGALFVTGGNDEVFAWLAEHRLEDRRQEAVVLLEAAVALAPERHSARLAEVKSR